MAFLINAATITTKVSVGTSATLVNIASIVANFSAPQVRVICKGIDAVIKFGDSGVVASNTYNSNDLANGNFVMLGGTVESFNIPQGTTHASVICEDNASTGGSVIISAGGGEP